MFSANVNISKIKIGFRPLIINESGTFEIAIKIPSTTAAIKNPKKLSTEPTPLLEALLDGYYKYHLEKQKILSENKIEKEQE